MKKILIVFSLFACLYAGATKYIVAPSTATPAGNDANPGTIASPWFTLTYAYNHVSAGDTIYMRGGRYSYASVQTLTGHSGTSGHMINIWHFPGDTVTAITVPAGFGVNAYNTSYNPALILLIGNYVYFKQLTITGLTQPVNDIRVFCAARIINSNNCKFEQLDIYGNCDGLFFGAPESAPPYTTYTGNLVLNCDFHQNIDPYSTIKYGNSSGLSVTRCGLNGYNTVRGCRSWYNGDEGIDTWQNDGMVYIDNCWCFLNGYSWLTGTTWPTGDGDGFKLGESVNVLPTTILRKVTNCVSYKNKLSGFDQNNAVCVVELDNNIAMNNGNWGFWFASKSSYASWTLPDDAIYHIARNNIAYNNGYIDAFSVQSTLTTNSFLNLNINNTSLCTVSDIDFISTDYTQMIRSRNNDGSLPTITFLHLVSDSDLLRKGTDVGYGTDLGPFQTTGSPPVGIPSHGTRVTYRGKTLKYMGKIIKY